MMCGICGFVDLRGAPVDETLGRQMMDLLAHRGPDGEGLLVRQGTGFRDRPSVFLGHGRLKIIDLSDAARQPLANEDGTVWVIFNGEIYNYRDLRRELKQRGHVFRSHSDTETIVHAYEEFGERDFIRHLDGMFAFALWDERRAALVLARDRSGKKPLFYAHDGHRLTFASEIKALLVCPWITRSVATARIPEYFAFGYVPTPHTLYEGIYHLPPASYMVVDPSGARDPVSYWELTFGESSGRRVSEREAAGRVRELLTEAVARRLISDVPLGALLSGGLDSSIVVGIMSQLMKEPVRTFSIGFSDDLSFDERPYAAIAANHFKTKHTEFLVKADAVALLDLLLWHHDQPYGDSSAVPTYLVARLARQHVTVALNGDGGDEVFAGYDRFVAASLAARTPRFLAPVGRTLARMLPENSGYYSFSRRLRRFFEYADASVDRRFIGWISIFDVSTLRELLDPDLGALLGETSLYRSVYRCYERAAELPWLHRLLYLNFMTYLPDDLHVKMDRMSMANSLETRSPMLDTAVVEFVASLPPELKLRWGQTKRILKLAFADLLPGRLLDRKKHGFGVPLGQWFRRQLRPFAEEMLLAPDARSKTYLRQDVVRTLFSQHIVGAMEHGNRLWALLNFELWLRMLESGMTTVQQRPRVSLDAALADVRASG